MFTKRCILFLLLFSVTAVFAAAAENDDSNGSAPVWSPGIERTSTPQPQLIGEDYKVLAKSINDWKKGFFTGNPTIAKTSTGRLLALYSGDTRGFASLIKSDDNGCSWQRLNSLDVIPWPNLFVAKSGIYVIYPTAIWKSPNKDRSCMEIIRSTDDGKTWSEPTEIECTRGLAVHTGNAGVLVSRGRVACSFEVAPTMCVPVPQTKLAEPAAFREDDFDEKATWLKVEDASAVARYTLVCLESGKKKLHCRVMDVDEKNSRFLLRPENWGRHERYKVSPVNSSGPWIFRPGTTLEAAAGTLGNKRDFWVMAVDAPDDEDVNLCDSELWRISNPVANPVFAYSKAMHDVFGMIFDYRDENGRPDDAGRWSGWLEGTCIRLGHEGGDGRILNLLRMSQNVNDSISGRVIFDDSGDELIAEFERIGFDEGLGVTHCYAEYDVKSGLYWMASNVNRNSTRDISDIKMKGGLATQERSNLALFYSRNAADWFMAGMVAYSRGWAHSYHYPHFVISGDDLLVIARSHVESPLTEKTMNVDGDTADNHDGNAITLHRVPDFRQLANSDFIDYAEY
ncbi:putative neuraminidase (sialidase) [Limihaloglobus sulfuriphilus]|uniref:Putative neuraminidase (Sialidase) n=1 Tax=Limihaloglobus sulfuriphilus TaxID=1851148 RepID=A0A1Q2MI55_9BACT|nr:sialidase family protein [Limihaloglobus sulfuriphilus]AQQ71942.1 putative neuraminidase (sialidase) [Limihaloglobus sulfuriphilus]